MSKESPKYLATAAVGILIGVGGTVLATEVLNGEPQPTPDPMVVGTSDVDALA